jgi:hypothetical protein
LPSKHSFLSKEKEFIAIRRWQAPEDGLESLLQGVQEGVDRHTRAGKERARH